MGVQDTKLTLQPTQESPLKDYLEGQEILQEEAREAEKTKIHTLRGGSAGCLMEDGTVIGTSPFTTLARFNGVQFGHSESTLKIFTGGHTNEDTWAKHFDAKGICYLQESEYPLKYQRGEHFCTGRPDFVVGQGEDFEPKYGIENKGVFSFNTAKSVFVGGKPKCGHFIQACHYMYKFGIPWVLIYSSTARHGSGVLKIPPQDMEFKIGLSGGQFYYINPLTKYKVNTRITIKGIEDYYNLILKMHETGDLTQGKLSDTDMFGDRFFWDVNLYDESQLMSRPKDYGFQMKPWLERLRTLTEQPYMLQVRSVKKVRQYQVTENGEVVQWFPTYEEAMIFIDTPLKGFRL